MSALRTAAVLVGAAIGGAFIVLIEDPWEGEHA